MFNVTKVSPSYGLNKPDYLDEIGSADTKEQAIELLRDHFMNHNIMTLTIKDIPDCIRINAEANIERNPNLEISIEEDNVVFLDGQAPEMDYYTIVEA